MNITDLLHLSSQEEQYETACQKFTTAMQIVGYKPTLSYNIALCNYMLKQYAPALKHIADIIERGIREHPGESRWLLRNQQFTARVKFYCRPEVTFKSVVMVYLGANVE